MTIKTHPAPPWHAGRAVTSPAGTRGKICTRTDRGMCDEFVAEVVSPLTDRALVLRQAQLTVANAQMREALGLWLHCAYDHPDACRCGREAGRAAIQAADEDIAHTCTQCDDAALPGSATCDDDGCVLDERAHIFDGMGEP